MFHPMVAKNTFRHDNGMYDFACRCMNEFLHAIPCTFRNHSKNHAHRQVGGSYGSASPSICTDSDLN